jgi:stalled ribosome rescue protein Dom34
MPNHVAVWIDHREAQVFRITTDHIDEQTVRVPQHMHRKHPKLSQGAQDHPGDTRHFFHAVSRSLDGAEKILVVGPATAKREFVQYVHQHEHTIEPHIVGIETVDHPTNGQLVAYAKKYFGMPVRVFER